MSKPWYLSLKVLQSNMRRQLKHKAWNEEAIGTTTTGCVRITNSVRADTVTQHGLTTLNREDGPWAHGKYLVKRTMPTQGTRVWSLGWEDPLEQEMTIHSSILAWKISWTEKPGGPQSVGLQRAGHNWAPEHTRHFYIDVSFTNPSQRFLESQDIPLPEYRPKYSADLTNPSNSPCFTHNLGSFLTNLVFTIDILPVPQERNLSPTWLLWSNHSLSSPFLLIFTLWMSFKFPDTGRVWGKEEKRESEDVDSWVASPMQWTWTWVNSEQWWVTGRLGMLQSMGSQRDRHDWATVQLQQPFK